MVNLEKTETSLQSDLEKTLKATVAEFKLDLECELSILDQYLIGHYNYDKNNVEAKTGQTLISELNDICEERAGSNCFFNEVDSKRFARATLDDISDLIETYQSRWDEEKVQKVRVQQWCSRMGMTVSQYSNEL
jgi:hypothetical protein